MSLYTPIPGRANKAPKKLTEKQLEKVAEQSKAYWGQRAADRQAKLDNLMRKPRSN
jgi:hypothetical protein